MSCRLLIAGAILTALLGIEQSANAQAIIVPVDPLKQRDEYFGRIINEWYQLYLGRKPSDKEHAAAMQKVRTGSNAITIQATIISGDDYYKKNGSTTKGFINAVFNDVAGRKPNATELLKLEPQVNLSGRYKFAVEMLTKNQLPVVNPFVPVVPVVPMGGRP